MHAASQPFDGLSGVSESQNVPHFTRETVFLTFVVPAVLGDEKQLVRQRLLDAYDIGTLVLYHHGRGRIPELPGIGPVLRFTISDIVRHYSDFGQSVRFCIAGQYRNDCQQEQ